MSQRKFDAEYNAKEKMFVDQYAKSLREKRRREKAERELEEKMFEASGIEDKEVIRRLIAIRIEPDTLAALSLVPLVEVAWADRRLDEKERKAILEAAEKYGVAGDTPGRALLESWLDEKPDDCLLEAWKDYAGALSHGLDDHLRIALRDSILGHARAVAEETGGILGLGSKISDAEQKVLDELQEAFE